MRPRMSTSYLVGLVVLTALTSFVGLYVSTSMYVPQPNIADGGIQVVVFDSDQEPVVQEVVRFEPIVGRQALKYFRCQPVPAPTLTYVSTTSRPWASIKLSTTELLLKHPA
jgi:hypothetical protein